MRCQTSWVYRFWVISHLFLVGIWDLSGSLQNWFHPELMFSGLSFVLESRFSCYGNESSETLILATWSPPRERPVHPILVPGSEPLLHDALVSQYFWNINTQWFPHWRSERGSLGSRPSSSDAASYLSL